MNMGYTINLRNQILSWDEDERRFKRIVRRVLVVFAVFAIIVPWLPVPEIDRRQQEMVPIRIARVMLEKQQKPVPPKQAEPKRVEETPKQEKKIEENKKQPDQKPKQEVSVREKVSKVGLMALRNELAELRDTQVLQSIKNTNKKFTASAKEQTRADRVPLTDSVLKGSGGIDTSKLSNDIAKTALSERSATKVESKLGAGGRGGPGNERTNGRTIEEIQLVLERYKGSFNLLYTKQLRVDPSIRGKVLFELTIAPSGEVLNCRILQSELHSPELEQKFVTKLKSIDFGAKQVDTTIINYPLDFFPS